MFRHIATTIQCRMTSSSGQCRPAHAIFPVNSATKLQETQSVWSIRVFPDFCSPCLRREGGAMSSRSLQDGCRLDRVLGIPILAWRRVIAQKISEVRWDPSLLAPSIMSWFSSHFSSFPLILHQNLFSLIGPSSALYYTWFLHWSLTNVTHNS